MDSVFRSEEGKAIIRECYEDLLKMWPVPNTRRYIGETHIIECGDPDALPLLMIHGTMSNSASWMGDVQTWSRDFRVIAIDIPGEPGLSSDFRLSPAGNDYSDWLEKLMEGLGTGNSQVSIVGQSLGAFAALKYALKQPERVKKLSMLTTSGISPARVSFIFKALPLMLLGKWGADRLNKMISYGVEIGKDAAAFGALVSKHCRALTEPMPVFSDNELGKLTMPVQFFGGDHDVLLNTKATAERLNNLVPNSEINLLKDTGHVVINQTEKILEFMRK